MISSQSSVFEKFKEELANQAFHNIFPPPSNLFPYSKCQKPRNFKDQGTVKTTFKGKPFNGTYENVISSSDGRKQVHTTEKWPYSVHGVIEGKFEDETFRGTGIMIGPNIVLTAGHNLYNYAKKTKANLETMRFKPAVNGQFLPFGEVKVEKYFVSPNYMREEKEDFGILILEDPIGEVTGYFGLTWLKPARFLQKKVSITGYPLKSNSETFEMWGMEGLVDEIDEEQGLISHKIDTDKGQSGSGLVFQTNEKYFVCGVHVQGGENANIATLLTQGRYELIYNWIKQHMSNRLILYLRSCERLEFRRLKIGEECLSFFLKENLENLTSLKCIGCGIQGGEAALLGQTTSWTNLSQLDLSLNNIGDEGGKAIGQNTLWNKLSQLNLSLNNIGDELAKAIGQNTSWINLSQLNLSYNNIGDEGAKAIGQNTSWINLSHLDLSWNGIADEGAKGLIQNPPWIKIWQLELEGNKISDKIAEVIAQRNIPNLSLAWNPISYEATQRISKNHSALVWSSFFHYFIPETSNIISEQIDSIWKAIETSKAHEKLRITFILNYRSFIMKITSPKYFEDFLIEISHIMHSRLDFNFPLPNTEKEEDDDNDELFDRHSFNPNPFLPTFYNNQLGIEEGHHASTKNDSSLNLNSNNFSAEEEAQLSLKNTFDHSS